MKIFAEKLKIKIKNEKIKQVSAWFFLMKNLLVIILFIVSVLVAAIALSLILFYILEGGFEEINPKLADIISSLPIFWIISFLIFGLFSYFWLQNFPKGYKIQFLLFLILNIGISFIFGIIFYFLNMPEKIEKFTGYIPFHTSLNERVSLFWNNPDEGKISGVIEHIHDDSFLLLHTNNSEVWKIIFPTNFFKKQKFLKKNNKIKVRVKLRGQVLNLEKKIFKADSISPWRRNRFQSH